MQQGLPRNLLLNSINVTGRVTSAYGNIKVINCNLDTINALGNISLVDSSAKYLFSKGNVNIKQSNKIRLPIHEIWSGSLNIDNVIAGRISARYGNAIASRSSLNQVFGAINVHLTNSSVERGVEAGSGNITIKQTDGILRTVGAICSTHGQVTLNSCHVKDLLISTQNAFITNSKLSGPIHLRVDPRLPAILDLTNTQVVEQIHILWGDVIQFDDEAPRGPLPKEWNILVKGNVDHKKISLTSTLIKESNCYNISFHQTAKGLLIQGTC